jgi:hypothetical protein
VSRIPGWHSSRESKLVLFGDYRQALQEGFLINRSAQAIDDARHYVYVQGGGVVHANAQDVLDPSGASDNHGDRAVADAVMWLELKRGWQAVADEEDDVPADSILGRQRAREQEEREEALKAWR